MRSHTIHEAAAEGDIERVRHYLDSDPALVHARDDRGWQPLHHAAVEGRVSVVKLLLDRGADLHDTEPEDYATPLLWACSKGRLDVVKHLLERGADPESTADRHGLGALGWATVHTPHRDVAALLVMYGAQHTIHTAVAVGAIELVRRMLDEDPTRLEAELGEHDDHKTPLQLAVVLGRADMVGFLLARGAERGSLWAPETENAFAWATVVVEEEAIAAMLLEPGLQRDLWAAISADSSTGVKAVLQHAGNEAVRPGGACDWALSVAARRNWSQAAEALLEAGADANGAWWPDSGRRPLHWAALDGHLEVTEVLLKYGADPHLEDQDHTSSAIGWAVFFGHPSLAKRLKAG